LGYFLVQHLVTLIMPPKIACHLAATFEPSLPVLFYFYFLHKMGDIRLQAVIIMSKKHLGIRTESLLALTKVPSGVLSVTKGKST